VVLAAAGVFTVAFATLGKPLTADASLPDLSMTSAQPTGPASSTANLGPITVSLPPGVTASSDGVPITLDAGEGPVFASTRGGDQVTEVTIPYGATSTKFYFGSSQTGTYTITASAPESAGVGPATQTETVEGKLAFSGGPTSGTASSGADIGPITVTVPNSDSEPLIVGDASGVTVSLMSSSQSGVFSASKDGTSQTDFPMQVGQTSFTFYYGDPNAGSPTLTASSPGDIPATRVETINAPAAPPDLVIYSGTVAGPTSTSADMGPLSVDLEDDSGTVPAPASGVTIHLASSSPGGEFSASNGGSDVSSIFMEGGATSASFFYGDADSGSPTITVSASGYGSGTQVESIQPVTTTSVAPPSNNIPTSISDSPAEGSGPLSGFASIVVSVPSGSNPAQGLPVDFKVTSGPDAGLSFSTKTNSSGQASWGFQNNGQAGNDVISVTQTNIDGTTNHVTSIWEWSANNVSLATVTAIPGKKTPRPLVPFPVLPSSTPVVAGATSPPTTTTTQAAPTPVVASPKNVCTRGPTGHCETIRPTDRFHSPGGVAVSPIVASVLKPSQVSFNPKLLLENALFALLLLLLIALPAEIFNATLNEHNEVLSNRAGRLGRPVQRIERLLEELPNWLVLGSFALVGALLYCLIDPTFGFNRQSVALLWGLIASLALITLVHELIRNFYLERTFEKRGTLKAFPIGLVIAGILVIFSRLAHFEPGYMFGVLAGLTFQVEPTIEEDGRSLAVAGLLVFGVGLTSWFLWVPIDNSVVSGNGSFGILVLDAFLATTWVVALQSLLFSLIPMKFLDGSKVMKWNRFAWFGVYFLGLFIFVQTIMHPRNNEYGGNPHASLGSMVLLFAVFMVFACSFWLYFRLRPLWHKEDLERERASDGAESTLGGA
jgi:hypothetical protein